MTADLSYALTAFGWLWLLAALVLWLLVAFAAAVLAGRAIRLGERPYDREAEERAAANDLYRPSGRVDVSTRAAPTGRQG